MKRQTTQFFYQVNYGENTQTEDEYMDNITIDCNVQTLLFKNKKENISLRTIN